MRDPAAELSKRFKDVDAELDGFERQAAAILTITLMLSLVGYSILLQVLTWEFLDALLGQPEFRSVSGFMAESIAS
jgi:hypothetical protein